MGDEPVAIVGIGMRLPGGNDTPEQFADFLRAGRSGLRPLPADRWDMDGLLSDDPDAKGVIRCAQGGFLDKHDHFDAKFYNISPKEADYVDPQQRLALEVAWEALEDAGIDPTPLRHGNGGVYMAVSNIDFAGEMGGYSNEELNSYMPTGAALSAVSGRVSYFLGWRGPCVTIDTACSASLVAVHFAAQGLRQGETDIALCGGVNAILSPRPYVLASQGNMLSPDGVCKTFDDAANGYCRAEGGGALVLKRLSDAQRDGDRIYALVRGSAVGSDGESGSLMVPNGTAQEGLIRAALSAAGMTSHDISYIEAHGTGTPLGDPIEIGAISSVFGESHTPERPVTVGSLKTNIGHMESAAGIGGLIKTVMQMRERLIYPHLNFNTPSTRIPWETSPVEIPTTCRPWKEPTRRALVNSFGLTGTIASVVLEQAPEPERSAETAAPRGEDEGHVFALSAKTAPALRGQIQRYQRLLRDQPETAVGDLCYSATTGRAHFPVRLAGAVRDHDDIARLLDRGLTRTAQPGATNQTAKVAFLFSGGGTQYVGMGKPLYERFEVFREHMDACDRLFTPHLGRSIKDMILGDTEDAELIHQISYMQPALFVLEYAVAKLWLSWGVRPSVLAGHSIGEIVAATVAGLFTLEDAVTLMAARARLMDASPPGAMAAVEAAVSEVAPLLEGHEDLSVAAVNGTRQIVLSGGKDSLAVVEAALTERGVKNKRLAVSCASHSPLMAEAAEELRKVVAGLTFHEPEFTLISNLTGKVAEPGEQADPDYWARHLRESVKFADGMRAIADRGRHAFLEVGPATELVGMGKQCLDDTVGHLWLNSLHAEDTDGTVTRQALAQLYTAGASVDWAAHHQDGTHRRISLPTYAFDRKRHWLPPSTAPTAVAGGQDGHPLLGREVSTDEQRAAGQREFSSRVSADRPGYLVDHKVMGKVVFPGAGYIEILLALQDAVYGETGLPITGVEINEALFLPEDGTTVELRTRLRPGDGGAAEVSIVSLVESEEPGFDAIERSHVTATLTTGEGTELRETDGALRALVEEAGEPTAQRRADDLYADFAELGVDYGPRFQGLRRAEGHGIHLAVGEISGEDTATAEHLPPVVLDCAFQTLAALAGDSEVVAMPVGIGRCRLLKKPRGATLRSVLRLTPPTEQGDGGEPQPPTADLLILDGDRTVFVLEGLVLRQVANAAPDRDRMYSEVRWIKRSLRTPDGDPEPRHALLIGPGEDGLAALTGPARERRVTLAVAADVAEAVPLLRDRPTDVCWFWRPGPHDETLREECERNYRGLLDLRDALEEAGFGRDQRLWLVTEGGQWVPGDAPRDTVDRAPAAATLWGFGHVMWTEYPSQRVTLVDLPAADDAAPYPPYLALLDEWAATKDSTDFQVAYRSGLRHVRRVFAETGGPRTDVELVVKEYGQIGGVVAAPLAQEPEPEGGRVRVEVRAAGINLKDVFNVLGLHRQFAEEAGTGPLELPLGQECAGVVTAAGPDAAFQVGDEVVVAHVGSLRREVTADSSEAVRKPARLGFAEAAALPTAFLAAHHALHELAGIKAGDRVLIHSAAGGVGQAAVQLALRAGAEVFATASPHKWPLLRSQGVTHLMNSRTLDFVDEVLEATGGAGVDIVLSNLNKDFAQACLRAVTKDGRFLELGKVGLLTPEEVAESRPDVRYAEVGELAGDPARAEHTRRELGALMDLVASGELTALPTTAYTLDEVDEAFGVLSRGETTGKVVLTFGQEPSPAERAVELRPDRTYLITGGHGSLGRLAAERLSALGARHIALMGRKTPPEADLTAFRERLGPDTELITYAADVGDAEDVRRVSEDLGKRPQPLGGIVHAAGVVADAPVAAQTWESVDQVFGAKVYGSWLLHQAAASHPELDFFIGYSSVSSVLGSRGQANYAAGNAFLDTLMCRRHAAGLPGTSLNWGAWGEIGLAAGMDEQHIANIEHQGFSFFKPTTGMRAMFRLFEKPPAQVMIAEVDWDRCAATRPQPNALYHQVGRSTNNAAVDVDLDALRELPKAERQETVSLVVRGVIADLLHFDGADDVPPDARFFEVGLDSLAAVELKNVLELAFRLPLSASSVFDHPSVALLAEFIEDQLTTTADTSGPEGGGR